LDIQGKNKYKLRGDFGYIHDAKKQNLRLALILLASCLIVFLFGQLIANDLTPFFTIISVVLILPAAQFLSKFLSYLKYKTATKDQFEIVDSISDDFLVLGELPIIRGKKIYETLITVVTKVGVYVYLLPLRDVQGTRKMTLDTKVALESILTPKRVTQPLQVFTDFEAFKAHLRTVVKSQAGNPDEKQLGDIATLFIEKSH